MDRELSKVFNHERKSEEEFDKLNEISVLKVLQMPTKYANIMGPVIGNIGNFNLY